MIVTRNMDQLNYQSTQNKGEQGVPSYIRVHARAGIAVHASRSANLFDVCLLNDLVEFW